LTHNSIKLCSKNFELRGLKGEFYIGSIEELDKFLPETYKGIFDLVYSFGVIHHTPNPSNVIEQIKKLESEIEQKETDQVISDLLKKQIEKMQQETEKMHKYEQVQQSKNEIEKIIKQMDAMDDKKFMKEKFEKIWQAVEEMEAAPATLKDIQQNGLKPTISSGIQAPGTFTPVKGLFN
jgi:2-polyprenyl-3-methyl-5-hydroxy-6-metoxy-1,4-benzoquinol methylase